MGKFSKIEKSNAINMNSTMDSRSSSEILDINPNEQGFVFINLENSDVFYKGSTSSRGGSEDLCGGIIGVNPQTTGITIFNLPTNNVISGTTFGDWDFINYSTSGNIATVLDTSSLNDNINISGILNFPSVISGVANFQSSGTSNPSGTGFFNIADSSGLNSYVSSTNYTLEFQIIPPVDDSNIDGLNMLYQIERHDPRFGAPTIEDITDGNQISIANGNTSGTKILNLTRYYGGTTYATSSVEFPYTSGIELNIKLAYSTINTNIYINDVLNVSIPSFYFDMPSRIDSMTIAGGYREYDIFNSTNYKYNGKIKYIKMYPNQIGLRSENYYQENTINSGSDIHAGMVWIANKNYKIKDGSIFWYSEELANRWTNSYGETDQNWINTLNTQPININIELNKLDLTYLTISGTRITGNGPYSGYVLDTSFNNYINSGTMVFPSTKLATTNGSVLIPSNSYHLINIGQKLASGNTNYSFSAPVQIYSGNAYLFNYTFKCDSNYNRKIGPAYKINEYTEDMDNALLIKYNTFSGTIVGTPFTKKSLPEFSLNEFNEATFSLIGENTSDYVQVAPFLKQDASDFKNYYGPFVSNSNPNYPNYPFNGNVQSSPSDVSSVEFGNMIQLSGNKTIYGSYFYAQKNFPNNSAGFKYVDRFKNTLSGNYLINYSAEFSKINTISENSIIDKTILGTYTGTHLFSGSTLKIANASNYDLDKIISIYDNPINISGVGNYLVSYKLLDPVDNGPLRDYGFYNVNNRIELANPISIGFENQYKSGTFLINISGDGIFQTTNAYDSNQIMTYGLVDNLPSGNWINGIYDYRIGETRSQRVIYGLGDKINSFKLETPNKSTHITLCSGLNSDINYLHSYATYDDLLLDTNYSANQPQVWNQIYLNTSGNSTYDLGMRPSGITWLEVPTTGTGSGLATGTSFQIMPAVSLTSGGYRAASGITVGPTTGTSSMILISGLNYGNKYPFDLNSSAGYIFITSASGTDTDAIYYLAPKLYSGTDNSTSLVYDNPISNTLQSFYIGPRVNTSGTLIDPVEDSRIVEAISVTQDNLIYQTDTPRLKKFKIFFDYVIGFGDPNFPSRLYYSEQYAPQIWGEDGPTHGYIDIDVNNGSPITSIEVYRTYLLVFKHNSTYRIEYTGDNTLPFSIVKISETIGSLGAFGTCTYDQGVLGLSQYGIFLATPAGIEIISNEILPTYQNLDHEGLIFAVCLPDQMRKIVHWSIGNNSEDQNKQIGISYNYEFKSWSIRKGRMWNAANIVNDVDGFDILLAGDNMGQIYQLKNNTAQDTYFDFVFSDGNYLNIANKAVDFVAETPWMNFGNSMDFKEFRYLFMHVDRVDSNLSIDIYFDREEIPRYTRTLNMSSNVTDKQVNLGGRGKLVKFVFKNDGKTKIKINSLKIAYQVLGSQYGGSIM